MKPNVAWRFSAPSQARSDAISRDAAARMLRTVARASQGVCCRLSPGRRPSGISDVGGDARGDCRRQVRSPRCGCHLTPRCLHPVLTTCSLCSHAIVSSSVGPEYYVNVMSFVDKSQASCVCAASLPVGEHWPRRELEGEDSHRGLGPASRAAGARVLHSHAQQGAVGSWDPRG